MAEGEAPGGSRDAAHQERLERLDRAFSEFIPHNRALGLRFLDHGPGEAVMRLPYREDLVGDPSSGVLHGGAITALLDATSGAAVFLAMAEPVPIATLDLRIDYLRPATPGRAVIARATCYRLTGNVAFVRAQAYHEDAEATPIAASAGSFMIGTRGAWAFRRPKPGSPEESAAASSPEDAAASSPEETP
jgi:uncharacterized protein (TIGR00369 family)